MAQSPIRISGRTVLLCHAPEDATTAHRISEALQEVGIEVGSEMDGAEDGDQMDAKISAQINACALFMPIVSLHVVKNSEGRFWGHWKLALDRINSLPPRRDFIVPVVIAAAAEAAVPEEFICHQSMSLAGGEPTPDFVAQVKRLLEAPRKPMLKVEHAKPPTLSPFLKDAAAKAWKEKEQAAATQKRSRFRWTVGALIAVIIGVAVALGLLRK